MNTNEASLGQSTVQTYSTTEKSGFERAVFALECTARWLDNGCDPAQAAEQIRLAIAQIKGCIAERDVNSDPVDGRQPAAIDEQDERGAFEALYARKVAVPVAEVVAMRRGDGYTLTASYLQTLWEGWQARAASTSANVAQVSDCTCGAKNGDAHNEACPVTHEIRHLFAMSGESASAKANVAQGAEAELEFMPVESMQHAIVYGSKEAIAALKARMERDYRIALLVPAPPAQTAITDDARDAIRREALRDAHSAVRRCINVRDAEDAIAALTAAQSASGDQA